ncbi:MAG: glycoside hydrolase family 3 C-terminal domain-containing protein [Polyangiaceae bacterium]|nr:glycoside hydrolase family 3 C-terminal domain-containing protein [Polyangiaceae bacterium]
MTASVSFRVGPLPALLALALSSCSVPRCAPTNKPQPSAGSVPAASTTSPDPRSAEGRAEQLLRKMTLEEKLSYIGGDRDFYVRPVPRLGIPEIKLSDGPLGCRNWGPSTAYPATVGLAASFDRSLAARVGRSMARDCRARGVHVLLAPAVNIQRSPLTGRNFEYMGEDPVLAGAMASELVQGIQSEGVLATVKHFAANNQEWDRNHISSEVDERTLREIYFPAFESVVREAHVGAVMSSYNLLDGIYASHHAWLLRTVLKRQWGFRGFVMSDWRAVHDPIGAALGGCDLEMPSAAHMSPSALRALIDAGVLPLAELDDKVRRLLRTLIGAGFFDREQVRKDIPLDDPSSRAVALEAARESLVLLKNEDGLLPLDAGRVKKIALVGPNADPAVTGGSGSSYVDPLHAVSIKDGLAAVVPHVQVSYHPGIQERTSLSAMGARVFSGPVTEEIFQGKAFDAAPVATREADRIDFTPGSGAAPAEGVGTEYYSIRWTGTVDLPKTGRYDLVTTADDGIRVFVDDDKVLDDWSDHAPNITHKTVSLTRGKHRVRVEYYQATLGAVAQFGLGPAVEGSVLSGADTLDRALDDADAVVVCLGFGQRAATNSLSRSFAVFWPPVWAREANLVEAEDSDRRFALPDAQIATLRRVIASRRPTVVVLNAGGGVDLEGWIDEVRGLLWAWYPGQEGGTAIAETLFGRRNPSGKLPITLAKQYADHPSAPYYNLNQDGKTPYTEGLFVGYRGFDAAATQPAFAFGFGLSYTSFGYDRPELKREPDGRVTVSFTIKNVGSVAGDEIAQAYVSAPPDPQHPPQRLEGFTRVHLAPGAERRASIVLPRRAFARWDRGWKVAPGRHTIHVGGSSRDHRLTLGVELKGAAWAP